LAFYDSVIHIAQLLVARQVEAAVLGAQKLPLALCVIAITDAFPWGIGKDRFFRSNVGPDPDLL